MKMVVDKASLVSVADAIREKGNTTDDLEFPNGFVDGINAIESGGGGEEESAKWKDQIQQSLYANNGTGSDGYISVFRNTTIKDVSMFDYSQRKSLQIAFSGCSEIENIEIDASSAINIQNMCAECTKLKSVKFTKGTPNLSILPNAFRKCVSLERVETMNFSSVTNFGNSGSYPFSDCSALKDLFVVENSIKVSFAMYHQTELSADSIQSIFGGLNNEVTGQTLTLKLVAVKKAFETSKGANDGNTSETWNALVASKPNWTISLS